jgi:hypothetical protein
MKTQIIAILLLSLSLCQLIPEQHNGFLVDYKPPEKLHSLSPYEILEFSKGFMTGLTIFSKLPMDDYKCLAGDAQIIEDLGDIIEAVKNFKQDYYGALQILTTKIIDIYENLNEVTGPCKEAADDVKEILIQVKDYLKTYSYIVQFSYHTMRELYTIENKISDAKKLFADKQYEDAGQGFGDSVHFAFLWAFNN